MPLPLPLALPFTATKYQIPNQIPLYIFIPRLVINPHMQDGCLLVLPHATCLMPHASCISDCRYAHSSCLFPPTYTSSSFPAQLPRTTSPAHIPRSTSPGPHTLVRLIFRTKEFGKTRPRPRPRAPSASSSSSSHPSTFQLSPMFPIPHL